MLEGKNVNLTAVEKEDLPILADWNGNLAILGEYVWLPQLSSAELQKRYENLSSDSKWFFISRKDGAKVGYIAHFPSSEQLGMEIGYIMLPGERGKGYGTEAVEIMVDYLFLAKEITRIQALADVRNVGSRKVLEKAGFSREGTLRKSTFVRGEWRDNSVYGILREEWKEPKILTGTT